jgi:hypothetical protein
MRIGGQHAVHIGPDFDALGAQFRADYRSRVIRSSPSDGGCDPGFGCTDKPSHHRHSTISYQRLHFGLQALAGFLH